MLIKADYTDFELIDKAIAGDEQSFAELVRRNQHVVASAAMNMLGNMDEAQEIGQQVFIRFYKSMASFKKQAKLSTYLTRITINLCLNHLKRNKTFAARKQNLDLTYQISTPDSSAVFESKDLINQALQKLEEHHRSVIIVRMIQGYDTLEAAEILNLPKGTVLSRLKRAMDKLRVILIRDFNYEY